MALGLGLLGVAIGIIAYVVSTQNSTQSSEDGALADSSESLTSSSSRSSPAATLGGDTIETDRSSSISLSDLDPSDTDTDTRSSHMSREPAEAGRTSGGREQAATTKGGEEPTTDGEQASKTTTDTAASSTASPGGPYALVLDCPAESFFSEECWNFFTYVRVLRHRRFVS